MVTGFASAAVHVAVTCMPCLAESRTEGSLAVQFALTIIAVFAGHGPLPPPRRYDAVKTWPFAGAAALCSTVAEGGATRKPTTLQSLELPALAMDSNAAQSRLLKNTLYETMVGSPFLLDNPAICASVSKHPVILRTETARFLCTAAPRPSLEESWEIDELILYCLAVHALRVSILGLNAQPDHQTFEKPWKP